MTSVRDGNSGEPREIKIRGRNFPVLGSPPTAEVACDFLEEVLLSELPDDVAVCPCGFQFSALPEQSVVCLVYGFRDGSGWALLQVSQPVTALPNGGQSSEGLMGLQEAVRERSARKKDVEIDTEIFKDANRWIFAYCVDLVEDVPINDVLKRLEDISNQLNERSCRMRDVKGFRALAT
jgi:hypothetical protein